MKCYRVPVSHGVLTLFPVVTALSAIEAREKAGDMAEPLFRRRVRWLIKNGRWLPMLSDEAYLVGAPVELHSFEGQHP